MTDAAAIPGTGGETREELRRGAAVRAAGVHDRRIRWSRDGSIGPHDNGWAREQQLLIRGELLRLYLGRGLGEIEIAGRHFVPGQGNNVYIFPAMGMAVFATEATRVTEDMFIVAAKAVAEQVTDENLESGLIYPPQSRILEASLHVAERVAAHIFDKGLA